MRKIDDVYLIDSAGNILISDLSSVDVEFNVPSEEEFDEAVLDALHGLWDWPEATFTEL